MFDVPSCDYTFIVLILYLTFPATPENGTSVSHPERVQGCCFGPKAFSVRLLTVLEFYPLNSIDLPRYM